MACTTFPSTRPFALPITNPMTCPNSFGEVAPVAASASSTSASTSASLSDLRRVAAIASRSGPLLVGQLAATGAVERLDRLRPLLDLLGRDLADLVVGELVTDLLLAVHDRGGQHPEGAETDLLTRAERVGDLGRELVLQRGVAHYTPPVLPALLTVAVLGVGCVLYGIFIERYRYRVVRHRLDILPTSTRPLVVLHLSDLHFVQDDPRKTRFLASFPQADVTIVTGDFLAEPEAVEAAVEAVRVPWHGSLPGSCSARTTTSSRRRSTTSRTSGSDARDDGRAAGAPELIAALLVDGWVDLTNVRRSVSLDGLDVELLGLDDAHIRRHDLRSRPAEPRIASASP